MSSTAVLNEQLEVRQTWDFCHCRHPHFPRRGPPLKEIGEEWYVLDMSDRYFNGLFAKGESNLQLLRASRRSPETVQILMKYTNSKL